PEILEPQAASMHRERIRAFEPEALKPKADVSGMLLHGQDEHGALLGGVPEEGDAPGNGNRQRVDQGALPHLHEGREEGQGARGEEGLPDPWDGLSVVGEELGGGLRVEAAWGGHSGTSGVWGSWRRHHIRERGATQPLAPARSE